jgi:translation initiation factor 3 subunit I
LNLTKVTSSIWGSLEDSIISGHETGELLLWDLRNPKAIIKTRPHIKQIMDLQKNHDSTLLVSASKDNTAKVIL